MSKEAMKYAFRRKGLDYFCTCDKSRYDELAGKPNLFEVTVFYTAPPKREWVGLTEEEIFQAYKPEMEGMPFNKPTLAVIAGYIEAKLKEKNT